jgi:hypothetical protein
LAFAANEAILDQRDREPLGRKVGRGVETTRTTSDDGNVEVCCLSHEYLLSSNFSPHFGTGARFTSVCLDQDFGFRHRVIRIH